MKTKLKSNRTFGVEIEMSHSTLSPRAIASLLSNAGIPTSYMGYTHQVISTWKLVDDSTVNGGRYKMELVSPILQGQEGLNKMAQVLNLITEYGCKVNKSCGVHVHVGITDYSTTNLTNLIKFYAKHQEEIDMVMQPSRRALNNNRWARPVEINRIWNRLNSCEDFRDVENVMSSRYRVVNVFSYRKYGTVEFRQHGGSTDAEKVCNWIVLLCNMCDVVKKKNHVVKTKGEFKHSVTEVFGRGQNRKVMKFFMNRATHFNNDVSGVFEWATANRRV